MLAWQTVRIYFQSKSQKRLVKLADLLAEIRPREAVRQTPEQMITALRVIAQTYGLPVRKVMRRG